MPLRSQIGIVFQDPGSSLNPRLPVGESIAEPMLLHRRPDEGRAVAARSSGCSTRCTCRARCATATRTSSPAASASASGSPARSRSTPELLVADEPTSALDVLGPGHRCSTCSRSCSASYGFACLFISHDLAVVEMVSSRIAVMHHGKLVEQGHRDQILRDPRHDYTRRLLAAVPVPDPAEQRLRRERATAADQTAGRDHGGRPSASGGSPGASRPRRRRPTGDRRRRLGTRPARRRGS